ncbi:MAG TPA: RNA 2',3'-cyclic phosphodiesterase [Bacillota bacterium]|jgi:2'-5' RNA ligase
MNPVEEWRLFVAISLPDEVGRAVAPIIDELRRTKADVKWVQPENLHLTLKFLGEVPVGKAERIAEALRAVPEREPFRLALRGIDAFPSPASPRVVWIGLADGVPDFISLAHDVDGALVKLGFLREKKPVSPHLTLGRVRSPMNGEALRAAIGRLTAVEAGGFLAGEARLYRSELRPSGPVYSVVANLPFRRLEP